MSDRADQVLQVANALYGAVTPGVVAALLPEISLPHLRRLMHDLVQRGAFVRARAGGAGRVWLTTRNAAGRVSGIRKWISDGDAVRGALMTKDAGTLQPPVTFLHAQIAGQVVSGFGTYGRKFDSELHAEGGAQVADGEAWPAADFRLVVEVERMVRQASARWSQRGGLIEKIVSQLGVDDGAGVLIQHLVVTPQCDAGGADFEAELDRLVRTKAGEMTGLPRDSGWWFLPISALDSDPVWHPIVAGAPAPRTLPGIATRRANFDSAHAKFQQLDRVRKARKSAIAGGVRVPAGVTVVPVSTGVASAPSATP